MFLKIYICKIWNIPDKTFAKSFMKLGFPCIKISKKIYLEKTVEPITLENILEEYSLGTINKITVKTTQHPLSQKSNDHEPILSLKTLSTRRPNTIKVRLLSNIKLYGSKISNPSCDTLLIHIHGGGFVSMASNSHQCYTRLFFSHFLFEF